MQLLLARLAMGLAALGVAGPAWGAAASVPLEGFIRPAKIIEAKISPGGEYFAATVFADDESGGLVFLRRADLKQLASIKLARHAFVRDFAWVNRERLVYSVVERDGAFAPPGASAELFAVNFDGNKQTRLIGGTEEVAIGASRENDVESAQLIDDLPADERNVLVEVRPAVADQDLIASAEKLDVYSGERKLLARAPVTNAQFKADRQGRIRFAIGTGGDNKQKLFHRANDAAPWELIYDEQETELSVRALGFNADGSKAYFVSQEPTGPNAIYAWDVASKSGTRLLRDPIADPHSVLYTHDGQPFAVYFMNPMPKLVLLDRAVPEAALLKSVLAAFPGQIVTRMSFSADGALALLQVSSDRNPGRYYVVDRNGKPTPAFATRDGIEPEQMAEQAPVKLKARDGLEIYGYLTLPKGAEPRRLPLIVRPHGGPFVSFDAWGFDPEVQLFANRGYAVLQVNYRGSGNFGRSFLRAGYRQWSGAVEDDVADAVRWAIREGYADAERICIYGAGLGAYAALMSAAKDPTLYKCAVGYAGVYDTGKPYELGVSRKSQSGISFWNEAMGGAPDRVAIPSPTKLAAKIKAPVLLVAGGQDARAPKAHSEAMRDALKAAGRAPEWLIDENEAHGFYRESANRELYARMLAFFDKRIGPAERSVAKSAPPPAPAPAPVMPPDPMPVGSEAVASIAPASAAPASTAPASTAPAATREAVALKQVAPDYPPEAYKKHLEGWVELEFTVGADGSVRDVVVVRAQPTREFDREAIRAMQKWSFEPALQDGRAVEVRLKRRVNFRLGG